MKNQSLQLLPPNLHLQEIHLLVHLTAILNDHPRKERGNGRSLIKIVILSLALISEPPRKRITRSLTKNDFWLTIMKRRKKRKMVFL